MDISNWSTSKALEMDDMFNGASAFDQAIGGWDLSELVTASNMLYGVTLSIVNYDSLLIGWATDTSDSQDDEVDDCTERYYYRCSRKLLHLEQMPKIHLRISVGVFQTLVLNYVPKPLLLLGL